MKKIIIYGHGNQKGFNHYTIEKTKNAHKLLGGLFKDVFNISWPLTKEEYNEEDVPETININIENYLDFHQIVGDGGISAKIPKNRIDVFYGKKRMFITIHCDLNKRKIFHDKLRKLSDFVEVKNEKEKIKKKRK